jgi:hypothetical protein
MVAVFGKRMQATFRPCGVIDTTGRTRSPSCARAAEIEAASINVQVVVVERFNSESFFSKSGPVSPAHYFVAAMLLFRRSVATKIARTGARRGCRPGQSY